MIFFFKPLLAFSRGIKSSSLKLFIAARTAMEVAAELIRLAGDFRKLYESLTFLEISKKLESEKDNVLYDSEAGEFVEVLKVPNTEKGIVIALTKDGKNERIGKFPTRKLHYDLASSNPYLNILKVYLDNLDLLDVHLNQNPTSKIIKLMACVGLLKPLYFKIFENEMKRNGFHFLKHCDSYSLAGKIISRVIKCETNKSFLLEFSKVLINALSLYPLDLARSPRSETDLLKLEKEEKELLYKFYLETAEKGISYLYDPKNKKPYYLQIFLKALEIVFFPYSDQFDWREEVSSWFFSNIIVPSLKQPFEPKDIFSPRKENASPRTKERKDSISSGIERWRNTFSGSFRQKNRRSTKLFSPLQNEELNKYFNDIGKVYLGLFYPHPVNVDEDDLNLETSSRYLRFVVNNFAHKLSEPLSPRPPSLTDYFHEIEEIYEELQMTVEGLNKQKPSWGRCYEIQSYLDPKFNVEAE